MPRSGFDAWRLVILRRSMSADFLNMDAIFHLARVRIMSAVFVFGMEAGVFALNRLRIRRLARGGKPSAKLLNRFLEQPEKFLWTDSGRQHAGEFFHPRLDAGEAARMVSWARTDFDRGAFRAGGFCVLRFFRFAAKDAFSRASKCTLPVRRRAFFRIINFLLSPLVSIVEGVSQTILRVAGGQTFTGRLFGNREESARSCRNPAAR